jgi:hypothetical protein
MSEKNDSERLRLGCLWSLFSLALFVLVAGVLGVPFGLVWFLKPTLIDVVLEARGIAISNLLVLLIYTFSLIAYAFLTEGVLWKIGIDIGAKRLPLFFSVPLVFAGFLSGIRLVLPLPLAVVLDQSGRLWAAPWLSLLLFSSAVFELREDLGEPAAMLLLMSYGSIVETFRQHKS